MTLLPSIFRFDQVDNAVANSALVDWGHYLQGCDRPFGRQSFGLYMDGELVGVAVSASTTNAHCGEFERKQVVELARLCCSPGHSDLTRVVLRLWRKAAAANWRYWPASAYVSYSDAIKHKGDIYRFDGWQLAQRCRVPIYAAHVAEHLAPSRAAAKQRLDLATAMLDETRQALAERDAEIERLREVCRLRSAAVQCLRQVIDPYRMAGNHPPTWDEQTWQEALRLAAAADELSNKEPADGK